MKKIHYLTLMAATSLASLTGQEEVRGEEELCIPFAPQEICCPPPACTTRSGFFIRGDLLYWRAHLTALELDFGTTFVNESVSDGVTIMTTNEFDEDPHFKWKAGYRIGAGYAFDCSPWEAGAIWTHFQDDGTRKKNEDATVVNSTSCRVKLDQVDLLLAYNQPCSSFNLRPFIGVRGLRIHEGVRAFLVTDITVEPDTLATETKTLDDTQQSWNYGPVLGVNGEWDLGCGFGLYGTAAASLLYGHHKVHFDDSDILTAPFSREVFSTATRHIHEFNWNVDLAIGINWRTILCDSALNFRLGFEHHQYFNQCHLGGNRGDLTFDGGVFSVDIEL